jgi:hypothetical protein
MTKLLLRGLLITVVLWVAVSYLEIGFTDWYLGETESTWNLFKIMGIL